jgi:cytochrome c biogenesis protein CcdA
VGAGRQTQHGKTLIPQNTALGPAGDNSRMLRLAGIVISIGLADSLNPTTIAPALFLASGDKPRQNVARFTVGVFLVYFLGGAIIALGPGQLLLSLVPHPDQFMRQVLEVIAGAVMLAAGAMLWRHRAALGQRQSKALDPNRRSSALLGATITAVELPTAFPYFAAIAAIVGSGLGLTRQVALLLLFNLCFVLPLLGIVGTLEFAGDKAQDRLNRARDFLQGHWPVLLAGLALVAGLFVIALGATGIAGRSHTRVGRLFRRLHHFLPGA